LGVTFEQDGGHGCAKLKHFGTKMLQNIKKSDSRKGTPKTACFFIGLVSGNVKFFQALNPSKCFLYQHFGGFPQNHDFNKKQWQTGIQSHSKIDIWERWRYSFAALDADHRLESGNLHRNLGPAG